LSRVSAFGLIIGKAAGKNKKQKRDLFHFCPSFCSLTCFVHAKSSAGSANPVELPEVPQRSAFAADPDGCNPVYELSIFRFGHFSQSKEYAELSSGQAPFWLVVP